MRSLTVRYKTVVTKLYSNKTVHSKKKRYTLQNGTLEKSTITKRYITKWYTDSMVCHITAHYSHNQQASTNPWIGSALSLT